MRILVTGHNGHELGSSRTSVGDHDHGDILEAR